MMSCSHSLHNCNPISRIKCRPIELGESKSLTGIGMGNLISASNQLWTYVYAFGLGLMEMMTMAMAMAMAVVVVLMIVIIVLEELKQVGWPHQPPHQNILRLRAFY